MTLTRLTPLFCLALSIGCTGEATVPATASIDLSELAFGEVPLESSEVRSVVISNTGTEALNLFSVTLVQGDSQLFRVDAPGSVELMGDESVAVDITFAPEDLGTVAGRVQIRTSDASGEALAVDLSGTGTPSQADNDEDGVSGADGDCDDSRADVYPGAPELCDGRDNDCDDVIPANEADADRDGVRICADDCNDNDDNIYPGAPEICDDADSNCDDVNPDRADADGDGFTICDGDCDDAEPRTAPGQVEVCDGVDNDCDEGIDDLDADSDGHSICFVVPDCDDEDPDAYPIIVDASAAVGGDGSEATPFSSLADGVAAIDDVCREVYVAEGSYEVALTLNEDLTIRGAGSDLTVLTAPENARPVRVSDGQVVLRDMGVSDVVSADDGGVLRIDGGSVVLQNMRFAQNSTTGGDGGAVALSGGDGLTVRECVFIGNSASDDGGAIAASAGELIIEDSLFEGNSGADGGALLADGVDLVVRDSVFQVNTASESGGAVNASGSQVSMVRVDLLGNEALDGGGARLRATTGTVSNAVFHANVASQDGSALLVTGASDVDLVNATLVANGPAGAALSVTGGTVTARNLLGMFNASTGCAASEATLDITYSTFFSTVGTDWGAGCDANAAGNSTVNPLFTSADGDSEWDDDDLSLDTGSPAVDSGDPSPAFDDVDGSQNDRGHTGGPLAQP